MEDKEKREQSINAWTSLTEIKDQAAKKDKKPFHTEVDGKQYPDHIAEHPHDRQMYDTIFRNPKLEWHCPGRHGVIRDVAKKE